MRWTLFLPHLGLAAAWVAQPQDTQAGYLARRQYSVAAPCVASTITVTETTTQSFGSPAETVTVTLVSRFIVC
jgi:hypothetical protein